MRCTGYGALYTTVIENGEYDVWGAGVCSGSPGDAQRRAKGSCVKALVSHFQSGPSQSSGDDETEVGGASEADLSGLAEARRTIRKNCPSLWNCRCRKATTFLDRGR